MTKQEYIDENRVVLNKDMLEMLKDYIPTIKETYATEEEIKMVDIIDENRVVLNKDMLEMLKDYIPTIKETYATEEEIKMVDIYMFTPYGRRHFTNAFEDSFKLNNNGYFEFTLLGGQKQYVKSDKVFEYSIAKHLADKTETNDGSAGIVGMSYNQIGEASR